MPIVVVSQRRVKAGEMAAYEQDYKAAHDLLMPAVAKMKSFFSVKDQTDPNLVHDI